MANILRQPCDEGVLASGVAVAPCTKASGPWILGATILGSSMVFIDGMWPLGGSLFHLGEIPKLGCHLPIAYREQDVSPQFVERGGSTPQLEWGRLKWVKAILKVTPELRWHPGQFGEWESSVVPILSLEIGGTTLNNLGAKMNEPARHLIEEQFACAKEHRRPFVVRESEVERAPEIAAEFYPQNRNLLEEQAGAIIQSPGNAELCARICDVARMLGYNAAKTKMLVGQWRLDLVGLERKLQNELDEGPQLPPENGGRKRSRTRGRLQPFG